MQELSPLRTQLSALVVLTRGLNKEKERAKRDYYSRIFDLERPEQRNTMWKKLNEVLNKGAPATKIDNLEIDGRIFNGIDLAEKFNDFFVKIGNASQSAQTTTDITKLSNTLFLKPTSASEVITLFGRIKNSRSCDPDGIQMRPIKYVLDLIAELLAHMYNLVLSTGIFPTNMQLAKVTAIYKSGDKNNLSNYRPISILPVFSKCLEKNNKR